MTNLAFFAFRRAAANTALLSLFLCASAFGQSYNFSTIAGSTQPGSADGSGTSARFSGLRDVAVDADGVGYVVDTSNSTIRKISLSGVVTTIAGLAGSDGTTDGTGSAARFDSPHGIAVDASGNVFVADSNSGTIRKITPSGVVTTLAGKAGVDGSADGTGTNATFSFPHRMAIDAAGNIFVADNGNNMLRKITPSGVVTTIAGSPGLSAIVDGTGANARFAGPIGIAIDASNTLYVADQIAIRKVTPSGVVTTLAGSPTASGTVDGTGANARFSFLTGLAIDGSGNLYVTDSNCVRKITPSGSVTTIGGLSASSGSTDGVGPTARFNDPQGIAVDRNGTLFIADSGNNTVRKGVPDTASTARLINISSRGFVGTGDNVLIAGFVVSGQGPKTVLIRGVGPTLSQFSVSGYLVDPILRLYDKDSVQIDENNDWGGGSSISNAAASVGAFGLSSGSKDAALLITLTPGKYTTIVSGSNGGTGVAILEVYELP